MSADAAMEMQAAMHAASERLGAVMFGLARDQLTMFQIGPLRIYKRELAKMTVEEIESAVVGFDTSWEFWPEESAPADGGLVGLAGWLP